MPFQQLNSSWKTFFCEPLPSQPWPRLPSALFSWEEPLNVCVQHTGHCLPRGGRPFQEIGLSSTATPPAELARGLMRLNGDSASPPGFNKTALLHPESLSLGSTTKAKKVRLQTCFSESHKLAGHPSLRPPTVPACPDYAQQTA